MECPNLNFNTHNVDSQIVGSVCSLSLPSEPPDIRRWFSSYAYESPVLGTSDNFKDFVSQERGSEIDGCVGDEGNGDKENLGDSATNCNEEYTNQVSGSSHSLSLPSEPPDVGKWFSSYAYESPVLDTGLQDSHFKERECENDGFVEESDIETEEGLGKFRRNKKRDEVTDCEKINSTLFIKCNDSFHNKVNDVDQTLNKIVDSSVSFSLPSEPPDIGNWFSSYVYESPLLDTNLQDFNSSQRECMKDEFDIEKNDREEDNLGNLRTDRNINETIVCNLKVNPNELDKCIDVFDDKKLESQSLSKNSQDNDKVGENKKLSLQKLKQFSQEDGPVSLIIDESSGNNDAASAKGFTESKNAKRKSSEDFSVVEPESQKSCEAGSDKENGVGGNGFVSIRKKRCAKANVENSLKMAHEVLLKPGLKRQVASGGELEEGVVERKVLGDKSNMQHGNVQTVAGKWRCPQKSKPNLGPPMKQLRLEQWLHRI